MKNFSIHKAVEMVPLVIGVGMVAFVQRHDMAAGIGMGLVLQAAFTLALGIFAEARLLAGCWVCAQGSAWAASGRCR